MGYENLTFFAIVNEAGLNNGGTQAKQDAEFGLIDNLPDGWTILGQGSQSVDYGRLVQQGGSWKFELTAPVQHNTGADDDLLMAPAQKPTILVRDADGIQHEISLEVTVIDDTASIRGSATLKVTGGNEISSRLTVTYGADGPAQNDAIGIAGAVPTSVSGDIALYTLDHGTVELNRATGAYKFIASGVNANATSIVQNITFTATDGDGDVAERPVQITVTKPPAPLVSLQSFVDEAGMDNGGSHASANSEYGAFAGLPAGWTIAGAGSTSVSYGEVVMEGGAWVFKLTHAVDHSGAGNGTQLVHTEHPTVLIQDAKGNTYEIPVSITIADDAPTLSGDTTVTVKGGSTLAGDLAAVYGADGPGAGGKIALAGMTPDSVAGNIATYTTALGILTLDTATGHYSFVASTLPPSTQKLVEKLSFVMTDADGDTATLDVNLSVTAAVPPTWLRLSSTVSESGLENGQWAGSDLEFGKLTGLPAGWSVVNAGPGVDYGKVVQKNGVWSFELTKAMDHPAGNTGSLRPEEKPSIIVEDPEGVRYEVPISVSILDDAPEIFTLADEYIERYQSDLSPVTVTGTLEMSFGADGMAAHDSIQWDTTLLGHLTSKGQPVEITQNNGILTATVHGNVVFTLSLNSNGEYEYTQYRHVDSTSEMTFGLTLKDKDGDATTVEDVLIIHIDTDVSDTPDVVSPDENDRFVLYTDGTASSINGKSIMGNVLANDIDPAAMLLSVSNGTYGKAVIDKTGQVRYTLNADALSRMPGGTEAVGDHLTYKAVDSHGNVYERTVEIVINRTNTGEKIYMSDNTINGETHESYVSLEGDYYKKTPEIQGSAGNDKFTVNGQTSYATIDMQEGNNTLAFNASTTAPYAIKRSDIITGDGNDDMRVTGMTQTSAINLGNGNNVFIAASASNSTTTLDNSTLTMGDGDDRVRITNTVADKTMSAADAVNIWSTKLFALPTATSGGTLDNGTAIDLGAGNNRIEVVVNPEKNHVATLTGAYTLYSVYQDPYTAINNGSTITSRSGHGEFSTILVDSSAHGIANNSHIYVQGGNADITVNTSRATSASSSQVGFTALQGGNLTIGMYNGSSIETADGQDTIRFNSTGYALYKDSHIHTGNGDKLISLNSRSTQTVIRDDSSVQTGSGNDTITLSTEAVGGEALYQQSAAIYDTNAYAVLMGNSVIDAGAGRNTIAVTSFMPVSVSFDINGYGAWGVWGVYQSRLLTLSAYAINDNSGIMAGIGTTDAQKITVSSTTNGMGNGSYIVTGAGDDTISLVSGSITGGHTKYAMYNNSFINAGNGQNAVSVTGEDHGLSGTNVLNTQGSYATGDYYQGGSDILTGHGNDTISVSVTGRSGSAMQYSSSINAGDGNNVVTVTNKNNAANFGIISNSGIKAGNGDNTIAVSSWVQALHDNSYIRVGDGNNTVSLTGTGTNASYALMSGGSIIYAGDGANNVRLTGPGNAIRNSSILLGNGGNNVSVTATQGTAMDQISTIVTGLGNDIVSLSGLAGMTGNSQIVTGGGSDTISISGTTQQAMHTSQLNTGTGDDLITLSGKLTAAYNSIIDTGTGNDTISITSASLHGLHLGTLDAGLGDDLLTVSAANTAGDAFGLYATRVDMGDGADSVNIAATGKNAVGMYSYDANTLLNLGSGNDSLEISGIGTTSGSALTAHNKDNIIDTGDGNDSILLSGSHFALNVTGTGTNHILLGHGDDTITFDGFIKGSASHNIIDGGIGGHDELRILLDGVGTSNMAQLNGFNNATALNFESVVLDIFGRAEDTLKLTQENLDNLYKSGWATADAMGAGHTPDIYIRGTDYDNLNLTATGSHWQQSGTKEHNGDLYTHWVSDSHQDLYVMNEIRVLTS